MSTMTTVATPSGGKVLRVILQDDRVGGSPPKQEEHTISPGSAQNFMLYGHRRIIVEEAPE